MDFSKLEVKRFPSEITDAIVKDIWPDYIDEEDSESAENIDQKSFRLYAQAFCLYSTLLITAFAENNPEKLNADLEDRKAEAIENFKSNSKYSSQSDEFIENKTNELLMKEIRDCFAHGSFGLDINVYTGKIYFVLNPRRTEIKSNYPIVISAKDMHNALREQLYYDAIKYATLGKERITVEFMKENFNSAMSDIILPSTLLQMSEHYAGIRQQTNFFKDVYDKRTMFQMQFIFMTALISYTEDEFYELYVDQNNRSNKSEIFDTISLIRNSFVHKYTEYVDKFEKIKIEDKRHQSKVEDFATIYTKIKTISNQKRVIDSIKREDNSSNKKLAKALEDIYKFLFDEENFKQIVAESESMEN